MFFFLSRDSDLTKHLCRYHYHNKRMVLPFCLLTDMYYVQSQQAIFKQKTRIDHPWSFRVPEKFIKSLFVYT